MTEWQPIETIPENVPVLIYGKYRSRDNQEFITCIVFEKYVRFDSEPIISFTIVGMCGYDADNDFRDEDVTHWMLLPGPPK